MKRIKVNRDSWRQLTGRTRRLWQAVPYFVLVQYRQMLNVGLVIGALALLAVLSLQLIVWLPEVPEMPPAAPVRLQTGIIDDLEFWIEERHAVQQRGLVHVRPDVFVDPSGR